MKNQLLLLTFFFTINIAFSQAVAPSGGNNLQYNESAGPHDNAAPFSYTYTAGTGTNRLMLLIITHESQAANQSNDFASITYGGQTLTQVANINVGGSGGNFSNRAAIYRLREAEIAAASSTTVTINYTNGNNIKGIGVSTVMFQNVNQVRPTEDHLANSSTSATTLSTGPFPVVSNNYVVAGINAGSSTNSFAATPASHNLIQNDDAGPGSHRHGYSSKAITIAGNETPGFTFSSDRVAMASVEVNNLFIILPAKLTSFGGIVNNNTAIINWKMTGEETVEKYEIEKSNGANSMFQSAGSAILPGMINGEYNFTDRNSLTETTLYRLKIIEQDGRITYSNTLVLKPGDIKGSSATSPFTDNINLITSANGNEMAIITLYDYSGKAVFRQKNQLSRGNNSLLIQPISFLAAGIYYITIEKNRQIETLTIIK